MSITFKGERMTSLMSFMHRLFRLVVVRVDILRCIGNDREEGQDLSCIPAGMTGAFLSF